MSTYKNISAFILNVINTCVSVGKMLLKTRALPKFPAPAGDRCIVLGNGPSLRSALAKHPDYFKDKDLISVNTFALSEEHSIFKPKYCVMLDPAFWKSDYQFILDTLQALKEKTSWEFHLLIPREARLCQRISSLKENKNIHIHYFNYVIFKGFEWIGNFFFRKNLAMPQCQNVLVASLFFAVNLGYKKIDLFGADHNWHESLIVREDNVVCLKQPHFYENQVNYQPFLKTNSKKETYRMDEAFHGWAKVFYGHVRMRKYAESRNAKIYNATENSFVDAFERIKI